MKKFVFSLIVMLTGIVFVGAQEITFESETIDYGTVKKGSEGKRVFTFTNTGDKPLVLTSVRPGCGCTLADYTKEPVAPGKKGQIAVSYNTNTLNAFSKTIDVQSNAVQSPRKILRIKGTVTE